MNNEALKIEVLKISAYQTGEPNLELAEKMYQWIVSTRDDVLEVPF